MLDVLPPPLASPLPHAVRYIFMDLSIILTYRFNSRCSMCHIWQHPTVPAEEVTLDTLATLPGGFDSVHLTGGEPTLRADLEAIVDLTTQSGKEIFKGPRAANPAPKSPAAPPTAGSSARPRPPFATPTCPKCPAPPLARVLVNTWRVSAGRPSPLSAMLISPMSPRALLFPSATAGWANPSAQPFRKTPQPLMTRLTTY